MDIIKNKESKYFYIVVIITFLLIGIIVWQIFFADYKGDAKPDSEFSDVSKINLVFLDSAKFQDFTSFNRGDQPMIPWKISSNKNPFRAPKLPENQQLLNWWRTFNISLEMSDSWLGLSPDIIEDQSQPELVLFEGRGYGIKIMNSNEVKCEFEVRNNEGNVVFSEPIKEKEEYFEFTAKKGMSTYLCGSSGGSLEIIKSETYEPYPEKENALFEAIIIKAEEDLSKLDDKIKEIEESISEEELTKANDNYSQIKDSIEELETRYKAGDINESILNARIQNYRDEIADELELLNSYQEEGGDSENEEETSKENVTIASMQEIINNLQGEELLKKVKEVLDNSKKEFKSENEDKDKQLNQLYEELKSELKIIEAEYNNENINDEELKERITNFYNQAQKDFNEIKSN